MNALLSENYFFLTAMDPSAMMYAKAFKWVVEDRPYSCTLDASSASRLSPVSKTRHTERIYFNPKDAQ